MDRTVYACIGVDRFAENAVVSSDDQVENAWVRDENTVFSGDWSVKNGRNLSLIGDDRYNRVRR